MTGIWQETDHRPVTASEATLEWTLRAHEILVEVAGRWNRSIAYDDLAAEVQRRTGIRTDMDAEDWLDDVLKEINTRCVEAGKPKLIALVDMPGVTSREASAARLSCYEAYGARKPREKAATTRTAGARTRRETEPRKAPAKRAVKPQDRVRPLCPRCFVELPSTGICDSCD